MGEITFADSVLLWASCLTAGATIGLAILTFFSVRAQRQGIQTSTRLHLLQSRLDLRDAFQKNVERADREAGSEAATIAVLRQQKALARYLFSSEVERAMGEVEDCISELVPFNVRHADGRVLHREGATNRLHNLTMARMVVSALMDSLMSPSSGPTSSYEALRKEVHSRLGG